MLILHNSSSSFVGGGASLKLLWAQEHQSCAREHLEWDDA